MRRVTKAKAILPTDDSLSQKLNPADIDIMMKNVQATALNGAIYTRRSLSIYFDDRMRNSSRSAL